MHNVLYTMYHTCERPLDFMNNCCSTKNSSGTVVEFPIMLFDSKRYIGSDES